MINNLKLFIFRFWPYICIFFVTIIFFFPVIFQNKIPLPVDALVGAHVPWTEVKWDGYPLGVPIKNLEITDAISQFYPWKSLVGKFWREGEFPLWNEYMFSGYPFLATLHSSALYPLNFLYLFLSDINAWTGLVILQILLATLFTYLFLKSIGLDKLSSFIGSIIFAFSGYMIAWLEFGTGSHSGLWLPILLYFEYRLINSGEKKEIAFIALTFFCIFTAGDFQIPLYITFTYIFFALYTTFRLKVKTVFRVLLNIFFALGLGLLISAPQIIPSIELYGESIRQNDPYINEYYFGLLHWGKIVNFIWPDFFGNVVTGNYWGKFGFHEYIAYTGIVSLIFTVYSLIKNKNKLEVFFWITLVFSVVMLFPTPFAFIPYKLNLPGLGTSFASRIIFIVDFCLAVLAAFGISKWIKDSKNNYLNKIVFYFLIVSLGVFVGLAINILYIDNIKNNYHIPVGQLPMLSNLKITVKNMIPSTVFLLMLYFGVIFEEKIHFLKGKILGKYFIYTLIVLVTLLDMLRFSWKNTPFSLRKFLFPTTKTIDFIISQEKPFRISGPGIPLNYFMQYGINSAEGYDSMYPLTNTQWLSIVNDGNFNRLLRRYGEVKNFSSPLLDYANVKFVIDYKKNPKNRIPGKEGTYSDGLVSDKYKQIFDEGNVGVFENLDVLPKVWLTGKYEVIPKEEELVQKLLKNQSSTRMVFLDKTPSIPVNSSDITYEISNFVQEMNTIELDIRSSEDAILFISESYSSGWMAYVDEIEEQPIRSNFLFQSIVIRKGTHHVRFVYFPDSFKIGVYTGLLGLLIILVIVVTPNRIRKANR